MVDEKNGKELKGTIIAGIISWTLYEDGSLVYKRVPHTTS
jgi:hypothetical protein